MKISQLRNLSMATFFASIGGIVGGLWILQMPTADISSRQIIKWKPNVPEIIKLENIPTKFTDMKEALARLIFRKSRKAFDPAELTHLAEPEVPAPPPPPPQVIEQVPVAPPPPTQTAESLQLSLKGIYSFGGVWKALFVSSTRPQGEWLAIGTDISGWKLTKVDPNVVTISSGDQKIELKLYVDNQLNTLGTPQP